MAKLQFVDQHNMVAMLSKVKQSDGFHEALDFLRSSHIAYGLTVTPKIYVEHIQQFWTNATVHEGEGNTTIRSSVHGKNITNSEASIRNHLHQADESGISSVSSETLFGGLQSMETNLLFTKACFPYNGNFLFTQSNNVSLRKDLLGMSLAVRLLLPSFV